MSRDFSRRRFSVVGGDHHLVIVGMSNQLFAAGNLLLPLLQNFRLNFVDRMKGNGLAGIHAGDGVMAGRTLISSSRECFMISVVCSNFQPEARFTHTRPT